MAKRIQVPLHHEDWLVKDKRVERLCRQEGLKRCPDVGQAPGAQVRKELAIMNLIAPAIFDARRTRRS